MSGMSAESSPFSVLGYHDGQWRIMYGSYGQTGGMSFASLTFKVKARRKPQPDAEIPTDPPGEGPDPT